MITTMITTMIIYEADTTATILTELTEVRVHLALNAYPDAIPPQRLFP